MAAACKPHALVVPMPYQGHLNPLMRLCKALASHAILITFVELDFSSSHKGKLNVDKQDRDSNIRRVRIPFQMRNNNPNDNIVTIHNVEASDHHSSDPQAAQLSLLQTQLRAALLQFVDCELSEQDSPRFTCVISDTFLSSVALDVAATLNLPTVAFSAWIASVDVFFFHLSNGNIPVQDALNAVAKNDADLLHYDLPGLPPLRNRDLPHFDEHLLLKETEYLYHFIAREVGLANTKADMIVLNSSEDLEGIAFREVPRKVPVYPVGPLIEELSGRLNTSLYKEEDECLHWLDKQPGSSVLYISMGSITVFSKPQFEELLHGLEASGQRFLWVLRPGMVEGMSSTLDQCPEWFLQSTKDRGLVVSWAPQVQVLGHASVGGYLTHCGGGSVFEAVVNGVPMLCWPFIGDHYLVCRLVVDEWKVGMKLKRDRGVVVGRDEVEKAIKLFMEGEESKLLTNNASKLSQTCLHSLQKQGGSSHAHMQKLVLWLTQ